VTVPIILAKQPKTSVRKELRAFRSRIHMREWLLASVQSVRVKSSPCMYGCRRSDRIVLAETTLLHTRVLALRRLDP
jgi:hypothetical protein